MNSKISRATSTQTAPGLDHPEHHYALDTVAIIIGAGLAGCAVTRTLTEAGYKCVLYDKQDSPASETSAVPSALVRPQATRTAQITTSYFDQAFNAVHRELTTALQRKKISASLNGVLQLVRDSSVWPDSQYYRPSTTAEASQLAATEVTGDALFFPRGGVVNVRDLCNHWVAQSRQYSVNTLDFVGNTTVKAVQQTADGWQLIGADNQVINESPLVIVASAEVASRLSQTAHLPLQKSRGQITHFQVTDTGRLPKMIVTGKGSVISTDTGFWAGSTHQRQQNSRSPSAPDNQLNLQRALALCPQLETSVIHDKATQSWVGFRHSTPDRLPVVGAAPLQDWYVQHYADLRHGRHRQKYPPARFHNGLYLLTGFGSRGILHSVYSAKLLTRLITSCSPVASSSEVDSSDESLQSVSQLLHPGRFIIRQLRRGL